MSVIPHCPCSLCTSSLYLFLFPLENEGRMTQNYKNVLRTITAAVLALAGHECAQLSPFSFPCPWPSVGQVPVAASGVAQVLCWGHISAFLISCSGVIGVSVWLYQYLWGLQMQLWTEVVRVNTGCFRARMFLASSVDSDTVKPQHVLMVYPDTSQVGVGLLKKLAGSLLYSYKVSLWAL